MALVSFPKFSMIFILAAIVMAVTQAQEHSPAQPPLGSSAAPAGYAVSSSLIASAFLAFVAFVFH
ncbi:hypothetical protein KP509_09G012900 [Ceratopteris richardii]|uniref:Uncharacterized protein n=1 Tax=Ceratopteris richardii TaxID=49495 RepID=A0A8T2TY60_CERRI|nr:hypothetical protein KP509_09G012900 [Ceratopteris richardii]